MPTDFGSFLDENQDNWDKIAGTKNITSSWQEPARLFLLLMFISYLAAATADEILILVTMFFFVILFVNFFIRS